MEETWALQALVVASFTEIKTGYRGFETNEIRYFVCLLLAVIYFSRDVHELELATGNGFRENLNVCKHDFCSI